MVNVGFPGPAGVWFRNGGRRRAIRGFAASRHQSKIYIESNQSDFRQIFADLTSMQTLAIYRRLVVKQ
jgi:hypothetical protein